MVTVKPYKRKTTSQNRLQLAKNIQIHHTTENEFIQHEIRSQHKQSTRGRNTQFKALKQTESQEQRDEDRT